MRGKLFFILPALFAACGTTPGNSPTPSDDDPHDPTGVDPTYVIDSITLPMNGTQATALGMDVNGNGTVDNKLGSILSVLNAITDNTLDFQGSTDDAVDAGKILLLSSLTAPSLTDAASANFALLVGQDPDPAPCTDPTTPTTCRQHLSGNASFSVAPTSPTDATVTGAIAGGTFTGGPGSLTLQIAFGDAVAAFSLLRARARVTALTDTSFGPSVIAGAIPNADVQGSILPALQANMAVTITSDCSGVGADCGCEPGSSGETLLSSFDSNNDCAVTLSELRGNLLLSFALQPDIDTDGSGAPDALSVGLGITGVGATLRAAH